MCNNVTFTLRPSNWTAYAYLGNEKMSYVSHGVF